MQATVNKLGGTTAPSAFRIVKVQILEYADDFQEFAVHICNQAAETILNGLDFQLRTKIIQKDYSTIY